MRPTVVLLISKIVRPFTFCWLVAGCSAPTDGASQIRAVIDAMVTATGQKQRLELVDTLTADFVANQTIPKPQMSGMIYAYFQQNPVITVTLMETDVVVQTETAQSHFKLLLTGGTHVVPERLRWLEVELDWIRVDSQWKIRRANWHDVGKRQTPS